MRFRRRSGLRISLALLACLAPMPAADSFKVPEYVFTLAPRYEPDAWMRGDERFPVGAALYLAQGSERRRIAPDLPFSADAFVSYDGARVLFSAKRTLAEPWQVWEASIADGAARQITQGNTACIRPLYLPDGRVVYTRRAGLESVLEVARSDGGAVEKLTFAPGLYLTDDVLKDGRILFEVVNRESDGLKRELFTVYPDGSGEESLRCDHGHDRAEARQISSGDIVFRTEGKLARIRSGFSAQADLARSPKGILGPVSEFEPDLWMLTARRPGSPQFALYLWNASRKQLATLDWPPEGNMAQPVVVAARTPPRDFPSALAKSRQAANVLCLRAGESMTPYSGVAQWVQVYSQDPQGAAVSLGRAEVAADGSFFVQVPGDRPLRFELLDASGRILRSERNWIWFRVGEQRICLGCHAGPARAAENRLPEAIRRGDGPVLLQVTADARKQ